MGYFKLEFHADYTTEYGTSIPMDRNTRQVSTHQGGDHPESYKDRGQHDIVRKCRRRFPVKIAD